MKGEFPPEGSVTEMAHDRARFNYLALAMVLVLAAVLRFVGLNWDNFTHMHPDERFLTMVETSLQIPASLGEYFNTEESPLNPNNVGHGFFVYGTFPIFLVRVLAEWLGETGYDQVHLVGRAASAFFDLVSVYLVYRIGSALYRRRVGLIAAACSAFSVLLIQHAHFFVVDSFANTFILLGILWAIRVQQHGEPRHYLLFGVALGLATASKISSFPLAGLLPVAGLLACWPGPKDTRSSRLSRMAFLVFAAALIALLTFRIFQPYAFSGPSFFGIKPNPQWIRNIRDVGYQGSGVVDFPPALQWANRTPVLFALKNMILYGMGWPLGALVWLGLVWAGIRVLKGKDKRHILLVLWSMGYFLWRSSGFTPAMRYQLPVYPTLALLGGWAVMEAWERIQSSPGRFRSRLLKSLWWAILGAVLIPTLLYAVAFTRNYTLPFTRYEASQWIYRNVPGPVNLNLDGPQRGNLEPLSLPLDYTLTEEKPYSTSIRSDFDGTVDHLTAHSITDLTPQFDEKALQVRLRLAEPSEQSTSEAIYQAAFHNSRGERLELYSPEPLRVREGNRLEIEIRYLGEGALFLRGGLAIDFETEEGPRQQTLSLPHRDFALAPSQEHTIPFTMRRDGEVKAVTIPYLQPVTNHDSEIHFAAVLEREDDTGSAVMGEFNGRLDQPGIHSLQIPLEEPFSLQSGNGYLLRLQLNGGSAVSMRGSIIIAETSWDDGLPLRIEGKDGYGGLYLGTNQELYWADDEDSNANGASDKLERIVETLSKGDYLTITSSRVYASTTRVPQRYPLTTEYYRQLLGCREGEEVEVCIAQAQPGQVQGNLGFELVKVFQRDPQIGPIRFHDQLAEEAFTVYDHPKVLIFAKTPTFSASRVRSILNHVDLSHVVNAIPKDLGDPPPSLMLPAERLEQQREGGTWSHLFNRSSAVNRFQPVGVIVWWLAVALVGWLAFPITRMGFSGFPDGGYAVSRIIGLLFMAWASWMAGSAGIPYTHSTILGSLVLLAALSGFIAWRNRQGLVIFFRKHRQEIIGVELFALSLFLLDLIIRLGNPDLWHPAMGGEKPMDFSYLNAVMKSTSFPPYDPWFAGGYINYYYFGFVLVGTPIKLLGLVPAFAYNLVIPTLFSLSGLAAYTVGRNLVSRMGEAYPVHRRIDPRIAGYTAGLLFVLLGNLGTVQLITEGLSELGAPPPDQRGIAEFGPIEVLRGLGSTVFEGEELPIPLHHWYWNPSRVIPPGEGEAGPITEFPFFTFLYADLHAHMINLPLTATALAWSVSWVLGSRRRRGAPWGSKALTLFIGALLLGSIAPTNTWDFPLYWLLGFLAVSLSVFVDHPSVSAAGILKALGRAILLISAAYVLFLPYYDWYGQGYSAAEIWRGGTTPIGAYLVMYGLFLFILLSWLVWESVRWMASTPLSQLRKLQPYLHWFLVIAVISVVLAIYLAVAGYGIGPLVVLALLWTVLLFLRRDHPVEKRVVLVLIAAGVSLTFLVEVVRLAGDISRMNTVFKFYLQVWTLLSVSSGAALVWLLADAGTWKVIFRRLWLFGLGMLVFGAALYPVTASVAKMRDRMTDLVPLTLNGMRYMDFATYYDQGNSISLREDFEAVRWMQEHIEGAPVIVEANLTPYRWGSRYTIYTGLPGVLGWDWHQVQQRAAASGVDVRSRATEITDFYFTRSVEEASEFLDQYDVSYVVVGQLEKLYYEVRSPCTAIGPGEVQCDTSGLPIGSRRFQISPEECTAESEGDPLSLRCPTHGLEKFPRMVEMGILNPVYQQAGTTIYKVAE